MAVFLRSGPNLPAGRSALGLNVKQIFLTWLLIAVPAAHFSNLQAQQTKHSADTIRVATFNVSLNRPRQGQLTDDLAANSEQAVQVATILRLVHPDVVLLNEFDYDVEGKSVRLFQEKYLEADDNSGTAPLRLPHVFTDAVNTGEPSSMDLDKDGRHPSPALSCFHPRFCE